MQFESSDEKPHVFKNFKIYHSPGQYNSVEKFNSEQDIELGGLGA